MNPTAIAATGLSGIILIASGMFALYGWPSAAILTGSLLVVIALVTSKDGRG